MIITFNKLQLLVTVSKRRQPHRRLFSKLDRNILLYKSSSKSRKKWELCFSEFYS